MVIQLRYLESLLLELRELLLKRHWQGWRVRTCGLRSGVQDWNSKVLVPGEDAVV